MPTSDPVKVIGFEINGVDHTIGLASDSALSLVQSTLAALRIATVSGTLLAHLVGRWTWVMLLRRPSLSVLQHVYRYSEIARGQPFTLWPSVRRELGMMIGLLPLLHARLDADIFRHAIASDASSDGGGVVATEVTPQLHAISGLCAPIVSTPCGRRFRMLNAPVRVNQLIRPELGHSRPTTRW